MIKEYRSSIIATDSEAELEERARAAIDNELKETIGRLILETATSIPESRVNEINNALTKDAKAVIPAIANGVRVCITVESIGAVPEIAARIDGVSPENVTNIVAEQKALERQVAHSLSALGQPALALLTVDN